jgi:hypothetical protein
MLSAFVIVSAIMFWIPFFGVKTGWYDVGSSYTESISYDYSYDGSTVQLKKLSPADERPLLNAISNDLKQKPNAELFQLKAYEDVCAIDVIDCHGLTTAKVKPFIDSILSDRQSAETALYARTSDFIAAGSLFISIIALIFTALSYRKRAP